ncbi:hypothetical protein GHT06_016589 [Daphnia sinensis]|uniref:Uncharacterized protein n=1 Tax=Daphnia sinensis TaxID=1820382 RepID=A0AAD5PT59_9CRUS|nr:hypothetical protein GHT06_016589 [Daphnia sinensis]
MECFTIKETSNIIALIANYTASDQFSDHAGFAALFQNKQFEFETGTSKVAAVLEKRGVLRRPTTDNESKTQKQSSIGM